MAGSSPVGFGRRESTTAVGSGVTDTPTPFPEGATRLDDAIASALLPERPVRGHKGSFGKLLIIAGSLDYAGAALLVARAAGRTGAGLVTLAVPESLQPIFAAKVVEATTMALPEDDVEELDPEPSFARILDHEHDAIVIGPGLRPGLATAELVRRLIAADEPDPAPIVLDAEALRSLATMDDWWDGERRPAVLTPHAGEFARLRAGSGRDPDADGDLAADDDARVAAVRDAARRLAPVRGPQGRSDGHRHTRRRGRHRAVREPGTRQRRDRGCLGGRHRVALGAGPHAVRGRTPGGVPPWPGWRRRAGTARGRRRARIRPAGRPGHRPKAPGGRGDAQGEWWPARLRGPAVRRADDRPLEPA